MKKIKTLVKVLSSSLVVGATFWALDFVAPKIVQAQDMYNPIPINSNEEINDILSDEDIPTGQGGFARDYKISLQAGDQVAIDLTSDQFDTVVTLISADGMTFAENDDAPDGTTNSLLFVRIKEEQAGDYIVRVRSFGETGSGDFALKVSRLCECE
jgi:hypothetical protein